MVDVRYAAIRKKENMYGEGTGCSLLVQGCHFHCEGCYDQVTWNFNGGEKWDEDVKRIFLQIMDDPDIRRVSILGGEPLSEENLDGIFDLLETINTNITPKWVWLYTGFLWEDIFNGECYYPKDENKIKRRDIIRLCDVVIDGRYVHELFDESLKWRGSSNQRIIDVKKSLKSSRIIKYCD